MKFAILIVETHEDRRNRPKDVGQAAFDSMVRFSEGLQARGVLLGVESLKTDAVRIQSRAGKRTISDGPFAEAKEMVGGLFLLDCASKDEAIQIANECPAAGWATIEVREMGPCYAD